MHADELWCRWAVVGLLLLFAGVRWYYYLRYRKRGARQKVAGRWVDLILVRLTAAALAAPPVLYAEAPDSIAWAGWAAQVAARWLGLAVALAGIALLVWAHQTLKHGFSPDLDIGVGQRLVTTGPYRWVRHPLYLSLYVYWAGNVLLSANWLVGGCGVVVFSLLMLWRLPREEQMMIEAFGADYLAYRERTGELLPRLRPRRRPLT